MPATIDNDAPTTLTALVKALRPEVASVLNRALAGEDITVADGELLFAAAGPEFAATALAADELRRRAVGDLVTYVVNRNINFTNVCIKRCGFCAFSRDFREEEGYFLPVNEIIRRAKEAPGLRRHRSLYPGRPAAADGRRPVHPALRGHQSGTAPICTSTAFRRRKCCTAPSAPGAASGNTSRG